MALIEFSDKVQVLDIQEKQKVREAVTWINKKIDFLILLDELCKAMPKGKILSVAAYPPPTRWHPFPDVHWEESYFRKVAQRSDQLVPMMYDSAIKLSKFYQHLISGWTSDVLSWAGDTEVLLGIPVYDDGDHKSFVKCHQIGSIII